MKSRGQIETFRALCGSLGISLSDGNPVSQRFQAAERLATTTAPTEKVTLDQLRLMGEFRELAPCLQHFNERLKERDHLYRLSHHDTFSSEFLELRAALKVEQAGYRAIFDEPDVTVRVDGDVVGLACKRLTSIKTLPARISEARDQISTARKDGRVSMGMVVIDISDLREFKIAPEYTSTADAQKAISASVDQRSAEAQRKIPTKLAGVPGGTVLFTTIYSCLIKRDPKLPGTAYHCEHEFFFSRKQDSPSIKVLEQAIISSGNRPVE